MDSLILTERARSALFSNLAHAMADMAADELEPLAGQPVNADARTALAADVLVALERHVPVPVDLGKAN